jgi:hypothetical protein
VLLYSSFVIGVTGTYLLIFLISLNSSLQSLQKILLRDKKEKPVIDSSGP